MRKLHLQTAAEIFPAYIHPGPTVRGRWKPTTFNNYQLVTLTSCVMRTFRELVRPLMMDCSHILYLLHMTHPHLQRLEGAVRIPDFDLSRLEHTTEPFLL